MIDYYYEFREGAEVQGESIRYGFIRGYHPEEATDEQHLLHNHCWIVSNRVWLENANGAILVRANGREVHERIHPKEMTWIKLRARELNL